MVRNCLRRGTIRLNFKGLVHSFLLREILNNRSHMGFSRPMDDTIGARLALFRRFGRNKLHFNEDAICFIRGCRVNGSETTIGVRLVYFRVRGHDPRRVTQRGIEDRLGTTGIDVGRANNRTNGRYFYCAKRPFCRCVPVNGGNYGCRICDVFLSRCSEDSL